MKRSILAIDGLRASYVILVGVERVRMITKETIGGTNFL